MKCVVREIQSGHLRVGHLDAFGIFVFIQFSAHRKASIGSGRCDQLNDRAIGAQWLSAPIDTDKREKAMLDFVPLAGTRRHMTNRN